MAGFLDSATNIHDSNYGPMYQIDSNRYRRHRDLTVVQS